jgi:hypothetical protein
MSARRVLKPNHTRKCICADCQRWKHAERLRLWRASIRKTDLEGEIDEAKMEAFWRRVATPRPPMRWPSTASSWGDFA